MSSEHVRVVVNEPEIRAEAGRNILAALRRAMPDRTPRERWESQWELLTGVPWREWGTVTLERNDGTRIVLSGRVHGYLQQEVVQGLPDNGWATWCLTGRRSLSVLVDAPRRGS